jgi:hypothetical protein
LAVINHLIATSSGSIAAFKKDVNELYLVDGEHLAIALLHLLELPQEVPAQKTKKTLSSKYASKKQSNNPSIATRVFSTDQNLDLARTSLVAQSFMR